APERGEGLDEPAGWIDLEVLALGDLDHARDGAPVLGSDRPVRLGADTEAVSRPQLGIGDRLPEPLRRRLDEDLEHGPRVIGLEQRARLGMPLHALPPPGLASTRSAPRPRARRTCSPSGRG